MSERPFKMPTVGTIWAYVTDGVQGVMVYAVEQFNKQVLEKVKSPEELKPYMLDLQAILTCVRAIIANHADKFSEAKRKAADTLITTLENLLKRFEDCKLTKEELEGIIEDIKKTIQAFKDAK